MLRQNTSTLVLAVLLLSTGLQGALNFSSRQSTLKLRTANSSLTLATPITNWCGTLDVESFGNNTVIPSSNQTITFANGLVSTGPFSLVFSGTYDPASGDTLRLDAGNKIEAASGTVLQGISVTGTSGSPSEIRGQPLFTGAIVLVNSSAFLNIGIQNSLTQSITMNGGTVNLVDNLKLLDGTSFVGSGTVNINNYSLTLPESQASAWTGTLVFQNARDLELNGYTSLTGTWTFADISGTSTLNGNGNILDLSGGGALNFGAGHTCYMTDVHIKGLGSGMGSLNLGVGATIKMSRVTIELGANYSHTQGTLYVQGDSCQVISGNTSGGNYSFNVSATGNITVDHAVLSYDPLLGQNVSPFSFTNVGSQESLINGGEIRSAILSSVLSNIIFDVAAVSPQLAQNYFLTSFTQLIFTNSLGGAQSMTLDGGGYFLEFPLGETNAIQIAPNLTVTLQNISLKDFNGNVVSYGSGSSLQFGNNVLLELNADVTFNGGATPWTCVGNATIEANGRTLYLNADNMITITGNNILTIKNANINIASIAALSCLTYNSTIQLINCRVCVETAGYTFGQGSMSIKGDTYFVGCNSTTAGALSIFTLTTSGTLNVQTCSSLTLSGDLNFTYSANPLPGNESLATSKRHLTLTDPSSRLVLDSCTLTTTATGLALDHGQLIVRDHVLVTASTSPLAELDLGSALEVQLRAGAILDIDGPVQYTATTYP